MCSILHVRDLLINSSLQALHSANISNISLTLKILIRSTSKFHKIFHFINFISFNLMFPLNRLGAAHWSWLIDAKYNWNIFFTINFFILNLSCSFKNVIYSFILRFFLIFNLYLVFKKTKFTFPNLFIFSIERFNIVNNTM